MQLSRFIISLVITAGLVWVLSTPRQVGTNTLPPLGNFFNPFTGFWTNGHPLQADVNAIPGLSGPVSVVMDDLGVPHVFAQNMPDAARVQGYLTARDRLFQMDLMARKASGRLSEVLGERTLEVDRMNRRRGMSFAAERALQSWEQDAEVKAILQAYAEGVNAWISALSNSALPVEYKLMDFTPEPWTPLKTALMVENMADDLSAQEFDLASTNTLLLLGRDTFDQLFPEWNPDQTPIVPDFGQWKGVAPNMPAFVIDLPAEPMAGGKPGKYSSVLPQQDPSLNGSNNWALGPAKTANNHTLLANDPHLSLTLPSIWYQIQLSTPALNAYGVSLPGVPGIIIGFNRDIAWGVTNVSHDVADWHHIAWTDPGRTSYLLDGKIQPVDLRVETIGIKGKSPMVDTVRYTSWGPVVYDNQENHPMRDYSLRWLSHETPSAQALHTFIGLMKGKGYDDYRNSIQYFDNPAQNFVFASKTGDIAIQPQGRYPMRGVEQGRFLLDGSRSDQGWQGYVPQEHIPFLKNPAQGFVYSANQHTTPPSYPYYYHGEFDDFRGRRIFNRLAAMEGATIDSMKALQLDNFSQRAADALPVMLSMLNEGALDEEGRAIVQLLKEWPYRYDAEALAPPYFEVWLDSLHTMTWDEFYDLRRQNIRVLVPDTWRMTALLQQSPDHPFFDMKETPAVRETAEVVVQASFRAMLRYFAQNPDRKVDWGRFNPTKVQHIAFIPAFGRFDLRTGGHRNAPNAINGGHGPSWRMIVELGTGVKAYGVFPGGQSGDPSSPFYDNMLEAWVRGEYFELLLLESPDEPSPRITNRLTFSSEKKAAHE